MMFYNQIHHFFVEKVQKNFLGKSSKFIFIAFLRRNFSKIFKFPKFFVNRATSARGAQLLGAFGPQKWEDPSQTHGKKFGGRHTEIAEFNPSTVVLTMQ